MSGNRDRDRATRSENCGANRRRPTGFLHFDRVASGIALMCWSSRPLRASDIAAGRRLARGSCHRFRPTGVAPCDPRPGAQIALGPPPTPTPSPICARTGRRGLCRELAKADMAQMRHQPAQHRAPSYQPRRQISPRCAQTGDRRRRVEMVAAQGGPVRLQSPGLQNGCGAAYPWRPKLCRDPAISGVRSFG